MTAKLYIRLDTETGKPTGYAIMTTLEADRLNANGNWLWVPAFSRQGHARLAEMDSHAEIRGLIPNDSGDGVNDEEES